MTRATHSIGVHSIGAYGAWINVYPMDRVDLRDHATRSRILGWAREAMARGEDVTITVGRHTRATGWKYRRLVICADGTRRNRTWRRGDTRVNPVVNG